MLMVVPLNDANAAPQDIPDLGVTVPCPLSETGRTRKEWDELVKQGAPVAIRDVKHAAEAAEEGEVV